MLPAADKDKYVVLRMLADVECALARREKNGHLDQPANPRFREFNSAVSSTCRWVHAVLRLTLM